MKILHCADIHLDSPMNRLSPDKKKERKAELARAFSAMIQDGAERGVSAVIIAGDLFDRSRVSAQSKNAVLSAVNGNPGIDFYYLKGNHDKNDFLGGEEDTVPSNLHLFNDDWTYYSLGKKIVLAGAELTGGNAGTLYSGLNLDTAKFNIVTLHGQEADSSARDGAETVSLKDLKNRNIDYLALGHIHGFKKEALDRRGIYCYPGCLEARGFDEASDHGYVILDINEDDLSCTFEKVSVPMRLAHVLEFDVSGLLSSAEIAEKAREFLLSSGIPAGDMVKLVLTGELDVECEKDDAFIEGQLLPLFYAFKLSDHTRLKVDFEKFKETESLKGEFIRTVEEDESLSAEDKAEIIRTGIRALMGEEIE